MSDGSLKVTNGASAEHVSPALSDKLAEWLKQEVSPRGEISIGAQVDEWWADFDACSQLEMAARVRQGLRLTQIQAMSNRDFVDGLQAREIKTPSAYQLISCYQIFAALPNLDLLNKAAALGFTRLRTLLPVLHVSGIQKLVQGSSQKGMTYTKALTQTSRELNAWATERKAEADHEKAQRALDAAGPSDEVYTPTVPEPPSLVIARDELLSGVIRARAELGRTRHIVYELLFSVRDDFEQARVEAVAAARNILDAANQEIVALVDLLDGRFNASSAFPGEGAEHARVAAMVGVTERAVAQDADASLTERAKSLSSARRGWAGAPPKSVDAVVVRARRLDEQLKDGADHAVEDDA